MMEAVVYPLAAAGVHGPLSAWIAKSLLIAMLGLLTWFAMRSRPASARHLVLGATLAAMFLVPYVSAWSPTLTVPVPAALIEAAQDAGTTAVPLARVPFADRPGNETPATRAPAGDDSPRIIDVLIRLHGIVFLLLVAHLALGIARAAWITRRAENLGRSTSLGTSKAARVRFFQSRDTNAPFTWGVIRPAIVMPTSAAAWHAQERHNAFMHELAHVERRDWLVQIAARFICAAYWFNPLAWLVYRQLVAEAEMAADEYVVRGGAVPERYARQLIALTRGNPRHRLPLAATTMAEKSLLGRRLRAILHSGDNTMTLGRTARAGVVLGIFAVAFVVGSASLVAAPPQDSGGAADDDYYGSPDATPLIRAAFAGNVDEVRALLDGGADVNEIARKNDRQDDLQRTALTTAAWAGHRDIVRMLLDAGAPVDRVVRGDATALIAAAEGGHLDVASLLLERGADASKVVRGDGSPLIGAARSNNEALVRLLLGAGADPDRWVRGDESPLYHALANGNAEIAQLLIDAGADVNQRWRGDGTPLIVATRSGNQEAVAALIRAGAKADTGIAGDGNALIVAAQKGDMALLQQMVETGVDVNAAVEGDGSPLIQAARNGHMDAVVLLLQAGADIDQVVYGDENALIGAAWAGDVEMVDYLLRAGADPTIRARTYGGQYRTALSQARREGHDAVVRLLESAGATE